MKYLVMLTDGSVREISAKNWLNAVSLVSDQLDDDDSIDVDIVEWEDTDTRYVRYVRRGITEEMPIASKSVLARYKKIRPAKISNKDLIEMEEELA